MAEKSGLFNAVENVPEYTDFDVATLHAMHTGSQGYVVGVGDEFSVTTVSTTEVTVGTGAAWIGDPAGWWYVNDEVKTLAVEGVEEGFERVDYVVLRLDRNVEARKVSAQIIQGIAASMDPQPPTIQQGDMIYDLVLAKIQVDSTSLTVTDERDGDLCPSIMAIGRNFKHSQGGLYFRGTVGGVLQPWRRIDSADILVDATALTLTTEHVNCVLRVKNTSPITITVPTNANAAIPVSSDISIVQYGDGRITFVPEGGVTLHSLDGNLKSDGQYSMVTLRKFSESGDGYWFVIGALTS